MDAEPRITMPPDGKPPINYAAHIASLDDFVDAVNTELRRRGFHVCEANVTGNWAGEAILTVATMVNAPQQQGLPILSVHCKLPLPWLLPEPVDMATILTQGLQAVEENMMEQCSRNRVLRISFSEFARRQSRTLTIAPPANGRKTILVSS